MAEFLLRSAEIPFPPSGSLLLIDRSGFLKEFLLRSGLFLRRCLLRLLLLRWFLLGGFLFCLGRVKEVLGIEGL